MNRSSLNLSLRGLVLKFREDDDPYERDDQNNIVEEEGEKVLKEGWEYDEDGKPVREDDDGDGDDDEDKNLSDEEKNAKKIAALEQSLRDERKLRRKIERDARRNAKKKQNEKKQGEDDELKKQLDDSNARSEKLARGLFRREVDAAIEAEARRQGFIDPSDAVTDAIRDEIDAEQDEDDPSEIDIDLDSVKDAVKDLANRKKHLVGKGTPEGKSGGRFGKKKSSDDDKITEQTLADRYPSLR